MWQYNSFDGLALIYLIWVMVRSWRYGPWLELYNLFSAVIVVAFLKGVGLFTTLWHSLHYVLSDWLHVSRVLALFLALVFAIYLLWKIRKAMSGLKKKRSGKSLASVPLGFVSGVVWIAIAIVGLRWLPFDLLGWSHSQATRWFDDLVRMFLSL